MVFDISLNLFLSETTRGHQFILQEFGDDAAPRSAWQIDPFGHSATQAWLLASEAGMPAMFWGRMDKRDLNFRRFHNRSEYVWQGSSSIPNARTFGVELWGSDGGGNYGCPINFDTGENNINDNPHRHDYNVGYWVDLAVNSIMTQASQTKDNHILWTCGSDFNYQNAAHFFHNLDKLIYYLKQDGRVNMFYSTPTEYAAAKHTGSKVAWELRKNDLFPYRENSHEYWTGYFSSRVSLKRLIRFGWGLLASARQIEFLSGVTVDIEEVKSPIVGESWTDSLEGALSLAMHHDGVSGTSKQDVADDYALRISEGTAEVEKGIMLGLKSLLGVESPLYFCPRLNISMCKHTTDQSSFIVVAWNPLSRKNDNFTFRIPVRSDNGEVFEVSDGQDRLLPTQLVPLDARTKTLPKLYLNAFGMTLKQREAAMKELENNATHLLLFQGDLPAMGAASFKVKKKIAEPSKSSNSSFYIENEFYRVTLNKNQSIASLTNLLSGVSTPFDIQWGYYQPFSGTGPQSGAYLFRPQNNLFVSADPPRKIQVIQGPLVSEIRFGSDGDSWTSHTIRLVKGTNHVEVEYTAGPILGGKELCLRYVTGVASDDEFYTDSNGREMLLRKRDKRPDGFTGNFSIEDEQVAGNYYPVNSIAAIKDKDAEFAVITDSTQGGSSLHAGELEFMVLRRLEKDDSRGVEEPLIETMCGCGGKYLKTCDCSGLTIRGTHRLVLDTPRSSDVLRRVVSLKQQFSPTLMFSLNLKVFKPVSFLTKVLPTSINIMTLSANVIPKLKDRVLLRFEHMYEAEESELTTFSFCDLFLDFQVASIRETTLTANMDIEKKFGYEWEVEFEKEQPVLIPTPFTPDSCTLTMSPMQVRTFVVEFEKKNDKIQETK